MLETHEFDGEAILDMADHTALRLADRYDDADGRTEIRRYTDGDHPARDIRAIWQDQPGHRLSRSEAVMTAIFRQVQDLPVGEPGQLCCKLVPLTVWPKWSSQNHFPARAQFCLRACRDDPHRQSPVHPAGLRSARSKPCHRETYR